MMLGLNRDHTSYLFIIVCPQIQKYKDELILALSKKIQSVFIDVK